MTPKPRLLTWTGENLDEWRARWPNAEVSASNTLVYGPGIVANVGDGMVEGGGLSVWLITAADIAEQFDPVPGEG
ncbi:hypothetical protein [Amycolatopsis sp. NPDC051128]|uniref:hypothetical protein n=1 Tax=Amycolatopsis sp. NPDC051128 TaxID=3155412 RepID=UPI00343D4166